MSKRKTESTMDNPTTKVSKDIPAKKYLDMHPDKVEMYPGADEELCDIDVPNQFIIWNNQEKMHFALKRKDGKIGPVKFHVLGRVIFESTSGLGEPAKLGEGKLGKKKFGVTICSCDLYDKEILKHHPEFESKIKRQFEVFKQMKEAIIEFKAEHPACHKKFYDKVYDTAKNFIDDPKNVEEVKSVMCKSFNGKTGFNFPLIVNDPNVTKRFSTDGDTIRISNDPFSKVSQKSTDFRSKSDYFKWVAKRVREIAADVNHPDNAYAVEVLEKETVGVKEVKGEGKDKKEEIVKYYFTPWYMGDWKTNGKDVFERKVTANSTVDVVCSLDPRDEGELDGVYHKATVCHPLWNAPYVPFQGEATESAYTYQTKKDEDDEEHHEDAHEASKYQ